MIVLSALLVGGLAAAAWVGMRVVQTQDHLERARAIATDLAGALGSDPQTVATTVPRLADETAAARAGATDPVWRAVALLPWVGPQLNAVTDLAIALDDLTTGAIQPIGDALAGTDASAFLPQGGTLAIAPLRALTASSDGAREAAVDAAARVDGIDRAPLVAPLRDAVDAASALFGTVSTTVDAVARASALLPQVLGADGERHYLLFVQNNAEWRSLGGIAGSALLIRTDDGAISLEETNAAVDLNVDPAPVAELPPELIAAFEDRPARFFQNVTEIPDFTVAAPLARAFWQRADGLAVDGVIAIDPVVLSYLLEATGPVTLPTGDVLSADNAVPMLLNEVYIRYEQPSMQDAFFAMAAEAVFHRFAAGGADPRAVLAALSRASAEHRTLVWSTDPEEQGVLAGTDLEGIPSTDAVGVYVNDGTGSKMNYYTTLSTEIAQCAAGSVIAATIANDAPTDAAESLPIYVTGGVGTGIPRGSVRTLTYVRVPAGVEVEQVTSSDGSAVPLFDVDGARIGVWTSEVAPGDSASLRLELSGAVASVRSTPMLPAAAPARETPACDPSG